MVVVRVGGGELLVGRRMMYKKGGEWNGMEWNGME
jgi:hypothetical protein